MGTFFTVLAFLVVVAIVASVLWVFVVAPFWVPRHSQPRDSRTRYSPRL